ncbi:ester cyclase [Rhodobacteraceae bacterium B1Z28]|uniref:Ester cyclase n=1 Tax=Ruegeria haliotis TaxID=2747601 RepID=A0ABX2PUD9_9RHOB|nr:ester cyclase [Ruegeria haliotis]NVO57792.1 ester cyclase [Ruegeria haliotis]
MTYAEKWKDFPDYIIGITKEIWEGRGTETLNRYYAPDIPVRTPMGISRGNQGVIAATMATCHEFPDRQLLAEDVIWSESEEHGHLSSHRLLTTATHLQDGQFGKASGKKWTVRVIADCAAKGETIYDEWLVRDYGGLVRQLGLEPEEYTRDLIAAEGGPELATAPFTPEIDLDGGYHGSGNDNEWGAGYADTLTRIMNKDFNHILVDYDRAVIGEYASGKQAIGREAACQFWVGLRSSFPNAQFKIHHQIGMDGGMMSPRAAIRWSLDGTHDGWGAFGRPTGAKVHVMGMSHAEFGPWGLRREFSLYDEVAIWKQILLQTGDT